MASVGATNAAQQSPDSRSAADLIVSSAPEELCPAVVKQTDFKVLPDEKPLPWTESFRLPIVAQNNKLIGYQNPVEVGGEFPEGNIFFFPDTLGKLTDLSLSEKRSRGMNPHVTYELARDGNQVMLNVYDTFDYSLHGFVTDGLSAITCPVTLPDDQGTRDSVVFVNKTGTHKELKESIKLELLHPEELPEGLILFENGQLPYTVIKSEQRVETQPLEDDVVQEKWLGKSNQVSYPMISVQKWSDQIVEVHAYQMIDGKKKEIPPFKAKTSQLVSEKPWRKAVYEGLEPLHAGPITQASLDVMTLANGQTLTGRTLGAGVAWGFDIPIESFLGSPNWAFRMDQIHLVSDTHLDDGGRGFLETNQYQQIYDFGLKHRFNKKTDLTFHVRLTSGPIFENLNPNSALPDETGDYTRSVVARNLAGMVGVGAKLKLFGGLELAVEYEHSVFVHSLWYTSDELLPS